MLSIHAMPIFILYFHSYSFLFSEMLSPLPFCLIHQDSWENIPLTHQGIYHAFLLYLL